jgi:orotate phosphoribosyltransferase
MSLLADRYDRAVERSGSILCLGLDPSPLQYPGPGERVGRCLRLLEEAGRFCAAVKLNENHLRGVGEEGHRSVTGLARRLGLLTVLDCKFGDIGETARAAVETISRLGYDAFTANPLFGNVAEITELAHARGLGVLLVAYPSGDYGSRYFELEVAGEKLFWRFVREGVEAGVDGYVVGLSPRLTERIVAELRSAVGEEAVILSPGAGAQGGDPEPLIRGGGERILINVGRSVTLAQDPASAAREAAERLSSRREYVLATRAIAETPGVLNVYERPIQLSSGRLSNIYIDCRALYSDPSARALIARLMVGLVSRRAGREGVEVATTATAGIPIASLVADRIGAGLVYVRMEKKGYGQEKRVEGVVKPGATYVGVDDVATTGRSALECVRAVREAGGRIEKYFVIVDRREGAAELLAGEGVALHSLARLDEEFARLVGLRGAADSTEKNTSA